MKNPFFAQIENASLRQELLRAIRNHWTHDSTAIEGNTLTLGDTDFVLSEGLTIAGKPLSHHQEVYGHAKAIELVYGMLDKPAIEEADLFMLHKAILSEHVADIFFPVGAWKIEPNFTTYIHDNQSFQHEYPHPAVVPKLMAQWLSSANEWSSRIETARDAVQAYAELHCKFVAIHPFIDGNGRMARLVSNLPLLKNGFPPISIPSEERRSYLDAIAANNIPCGDVSAEDNLERIVDREAIEQFRLLCDKWWKPLVELVRQAVAKDYELRTKKKDLGVTDRGRA